MAAPSSNPDANPDANPGPYAQADAGSGRRAGRLVRVADQYDARLPNIARDTDIHDPVLHLRGDLERTDRPGQAG